MYRRNRELWLALVAVLSISLAYIAITQYYKGVPGASSFFGHSIGVLGFVLMLMTETLYSLRKRSRRARWGRLADWLDFHIFTGIVGPFMVLLHSSWKFNGLAGILMLLTVIIVISGFIGRYIYTSVPRTVEGVEVEEKELERQIARLEQELQRWMQAIPETVQVLAPLLGTITAQPGGVGAIPVRRPLSNYRWRRSIQQIRRRLIQQGGGSRERAQINHLERLVNRQRTLQQQVHSLAAARKMLALWHTIHIPIGMVLFTIAFVHIIAAIYYATLLH